MGRVHALGKTTISISRVSESMAASPSCPSERMADVASAARGRAWDKISGSGFRMAGHAADGAVTVCDLRIGLFDRQKKGLRQNDL